MSKDQAPERGSTGRRRDKIAWTYEEAAEAMGISVRHLRTLVRRFKMPYVPMGRSIRFLPEDCEAWLLQRRKRAINVS